jgi:hypothetical protein
VELGRGIAATFAVPGALFLLTLGSGFWLKRAGRLLNGALFNVHKLIALAALVLAARQTASVLARLTVPPMVIALVLVIAPVRGGALRCRWADERA